MNMRIVGEGVPMKQTDLQGETERALRAATEGKADALAERLLQFLFDYGWLGSSKNSAEQCTSIVKSILADAYTAELLPLFNAGMEQARIEQDEHWIDAMGWTDLVHNGPYTQADRENYVKLLVDSVTHNMHEEAPPEQIATAVAGAYAAAAKLCDAYGREGNRLAQEYACETADEIAARIRALTPADARQHVLPCDPNDQVSETQFQKVIWDAIASVLGPKGQILANSLQEKLTIGIRDYLRWNCERAKAHRGEK